MERIVQQPERYSFAGNLKALVVESGQPVTFSIPGVLEEIYDPDSSGRVVIPLRAFFEAHLQAPRLDEIPEEGLPLNEYTGYLDGESIGTFCVLAGGIAVREIDTPLFLRSNFLTWQPRIRYVGYHEPQWLRYVALNDCVVRVKGYFAPTSDETGADPETVTLQELTAGRIYSLDMNYGRIRGVFERQPLYFDVWVENTEGERQSFVQRYVLRNVGNEKTADCFVFENSLGGYDTVRFTGDRKEVGESESRNAVFDGEIFEFGIDYGKAWTKYTGYLPDERTRQWVLEFFSSCRRYHLADSSLERIYVSKPKLEATAGEAAGYEFTFAYSRQSRYLNLVRSEMPEQIEIVGPGEESFFLPPRLNEFPLLDPESEVLLPAQYAYSGRWGVLPLSVLLRAVVGTQSASSGGGTLYHDRLQNLDIENQHPIKTISGLQAALNNKASTSELKTFVDTYNNHVLSDAHLSSLQRSILSRLSLDTEGNLKIEGNAYTTGHLSQLGPVEEESDSSGGTFYHDQLLNRDQPDQHPISAIIGLQAALEARSYTLPTASASVLGGVKVGNRLKIENGVLSADTPNWNEIAGKPTTLSGYGITDALTASNYGKYINDYFGFTRKRANTDVTWGTQIGSVLAFFDSKADGGFGFRDDNPGKGQMSGVIDGYWYQVEGKYRCLDTSDIESLLKTHFVKKSGDTMTGDLTTGTLNAGGGVVVQQGYGLSLLGYKADHTAYGIYADETSVSGTHGAVTSNYAVYLTCSGYTTDTNNNRGWIFRNQDANKNVASISNSGTMVLEGNLIVKGKITQLG